MPNYIRKFSIWLGNFIELAGIFLGFLILSIVNVIFHPAVNLLLLLVAWFCFWFFPHCLTHFIVGKIFGINFRFYFLGKSSLVKLDLPIISLFAKYFPVLGIKINHKAFLQVTPKKRAIMFVSGTVASMTFPIIIVAYAYLYMPLWITIFILILTVGNLCFTLVYSSKVGDIWKAKRTLKL